MHHNCLYPKPSLIPVGYFYSVNPILMLLHFLSTSQCSTGSSLSCEKHCAISWPPPPKLNMEPSFSMGKNTFKYKKLIEMNHPQPPIPIQVDNSTAIGLVNRSIKKKQSKAMYMRFHWIHDWILQKQVNVYWQTSPTNLGDYQSKHHPVANHQQVWPTNLYEPHRSQTTLQGCVKYPNRYSSGIIPAGINGQKLFPRHCGHNQFNCLSTATQWNR